MRTFLCLLRGINVGGRAKISMAELRGALEADGLEGVRTYVQSGNVAFRARGRPAALARRIEGAVEAGFGFRPRALVLTGEELEAAIDACPFAREAREDARSVHAFFLEGRPAKSALSALGEVDSGADRFELAGKVLYLHAPKGIGRSKLAQSVERKLGVAGTARNWRSVLALRSLAAEVDRAG